MTSPSARGRFSCALNLQSLELLEAAPVLTNLKQSARQTVLRPETLTSLRIRIYLVGIKLRSVDWAFVWRLAIEERDNTDL